MKKFKRIFWEEFDGGSSGGSDGGASGGEGNANPVPAPPSFSFSETDRKALASELGSAVAQHLPKHEAAPKVYSQEEIAAAQKQFGAWEPDDEFFKNYDNLDTRKSAMISMRDGMAKYMTNLMQAYVAQHTQGLESRFTEQLTPLQSLIAERSEAERETRFYSAFPVLQKETFKPLIASVAAQMHAAGQFAGLSESKAFALLASGVESVAKQINPEFSLGTTPETKQPARAQGGIPVTSSGTGGGGSNTGAAGGKPSAVSVLGPVRSGKR